MFKDIKYIDGKSYGNDGLYDEEYFIIIDDGFEQKVSCHSDFATISYIIMDTYEKRNLNVVKNFILYIQRLSHDGYDIDHILEIQKDNILYPKYKEEIEKYLLLL
jgi:hypothetical protein